MSLLPTILYLFRTLPIPLSSSYLQKLQSTVSHFIQNGKKPRFKSSVLYRPKLNAGMGVPSLKCYHQADVLDQLKFWWSPSLDHVWYPIEHSLLRSSPQGTLGAILLGFTPQPSPQLTIRAALPIWKNLLPQLLKSYSSDLAILPLVSLEPMSPDLSLSRWMTAGMSTLGCLMDSNSPYGENVL